MKPTIPVIMKSANLEALANYLNDNLGLTVTNDHLIYIVEQAGKAGGPQHDPWSESTWRMWLKGMALRSPWIPGKTASDFEPSADLEELQAALADFNDSLLSLPHFQLCDMPNVNDLLADYSEEAWQQLFPAGEEIGKPLLVQFEDIGGNRLLGKAPFASWLYARLVFLGIPSVDEENDLGGYGIGFVATSMGKPVGVLIIEADSERVEIHLDAQSTETVEQIRSEFAKLLLNEIKQVARCELTVHGAEVDYTNSYGWTGSYFLGEGNIGG
jgi:hypothetical protein